MYKDYHWITDVRIAMELGYSKTVIDKLKAEPNDLRRGNILVDARRGLYKD